MSQTTDRAIASLRDHHDRLAEVVARLSAEELDGPSAAEAWTRAQVLSHLGSGAEIFGARYAAAIAGEEREFPDNQQVWARWDDSSAQEQAAGFVEHDEAFVAQLEALDGATRATLEIDLGFGPGPQPLESALLLRLNEVAAHTWDVLAGRDPEATLDPEAADLLLVAYAGSASYLLGWMGRPERLSEPVTLTSRDLTLVVDDGVSLLVGADADGATADLDAPPEALLRLLLGRLKDGYTADSVSVTGNVTLDQLRDVFPGY